MKIQFSNIESQIIHILDDFGIDRVSMAGIIGTLRDNKLNTNDFLEFIKTKDNLMIEDCTDKLWDMRGYY